MEKVFDNGGDALGALGRHIDKVGRTHELILVDVLTDRAKRLFIVARRKRKVAVVLGVTLAGQFFARGMTAIISRETIVIDNPVYTSLASARIYVLPGGFISVGVVIALVTLVAATLVLKFTRFGRNIYALGGNEMSAQLMGLPTKRTKILAYVVCGF